MSKFESLEKLSDQLRTENSEWVVSESVEFGEVTIIVTAANIDDICLKLRDEFDFNLLADLCGSDLGPEEAPRFEVNYHLFSTVHHKRLRLKVLLDEEKPEIASVTEVWKTANWHERETFDLLGIIFEGHPDLRRILLPSDFDGHALRKDYPLRGFEPYNIN